MTVPAEGAKVRLDKFLASSELGYSRSYVQKLLNDGMVSVNGQAARSSQKLKAGDMVEVKIPAPKSLDITPEDIHLDVVYEDDDFAVINKPAGMVVHPAAGHYSGTLVHALLKYFGEGLSTIGGVVRPGIVHRLDKDTSGLIAVAKNDDAHESLTKQLADRTMSRTYIAVVKGEPRPREGTIEGNIGRHRFHRKKMAVMKEGGREAVSKYKVAQTLKGASVVLVSLVTGRTHQIRVHLQSVNCPVIGDPVYSRGVGRYPIKRQALHAWKMRLVHPKSGKKMEFIATLPDDMARLIKELGGDPAGYC
ncbi:MAG: RluA family pseudouridine synthase [Nitrospinae bacterium]|nr:RluA family pseudouridine synthase [Nitrospinota bacterium]